MTVPCALFESGFRRRRRPTTELLDRRVKNCTGECARLSSEKN